MSYLRFHSSSPANIEDILKLHTRLCNFKCIAHVLELAPLLGPFVEHRIVCRLRTTKKYLIQWCWNERTPSPTPSDLFAAVKIERGYYSDWKYMAVRSRDVGRTRGFQSRQHGTKGFKTRKNEKPPPPSRRSGIYYCNIEDLDEENELMIKWCGATFYQMARTKETRVQHPPFISVFQPHFRFISSIRPAYPDAGWFIFLAAPASTVFYLRIESIYVLPLLWRVSCLKSQR